MKKFNPLKTFDKKSKFKHISINYVNTLGKNYTEKYADFTLEELLESITNNNSLYNSKSKNLNKKSLAYTIQNILSHNTNLKDFTLETLENINRIIDSRSFKNIVDWDLMENSPVGLPSKKKIHIVSNLSNRGRAFFVSEAYDSTKRSIVKDSNPYFEYLLFKDIEAEDLLFFDEVEIVGNSFKFEINLHNVYANPHYHLDFTLKSSLSMEQLSIVTNILKRVLRFVTNIINIFHTSHTVTNSSKPRLIERNSSNTLSNIDLLNFSYISDTGKIPDFRGNTQIDKLKLLESSTLNAYHGESKEILKDGLVLNANDKLIQELLFDKYQNEDTVNDFMSSIMSAPKNKKTIQINNFKITFFTKYNPYKKERIVVASVISVKQNNERKSYNKQYIKLVKTLRNHTKKIMKNLSKNEKRHLFKAKLFITNKLIKYAILQNNTSSNILISLYNYINRKSFPPEIKLNLFMFVNTKHQSLEYGLNSLFKTQMTYRREISRIR